MTYVSSVFPDGPHPARHSKLDILVADPEGMFYSILQSYLTDFLPVQELLEGLGDPYDAYKRKVKKGEYCWHLLGAHLPHLRCSSQRTS